MVDSYTGLLSALVTRLAALSPVVDIVRPNKAYTPVEGIPYQRVALLPARTTNPAFGEPGVVYEEHTGIFQVTLNYPFGNGAGDAYARAGLIKNHFPRGASYTAANNVVVRILKTASIGPELSGASGWFILPLSIPYFSHIFS